MPRLTLVLRLVFVVTYLTASSASATPMFMRLGGLPDKESSLARDVSNDGTVVVGEAYSYPGSVGDREAFRWEGGVMTGLGDLPGGISDSEAYAVSADGSVVVGRGTTEVSSEGFRWESGVLVGLGDLPGGEFFSVARALSADGSVVVGYSDSELSHPNFDQGATEAFRWTAEGGMVGLGDLPGGSFSSAAYGVSGDGWIIVGTSMTDLGSQAFIWDETHGIRNLQDVLVNDFGLDLKGSTLEVAMGVSDDGRIIVGHGTGGTGWIAVIPEPSTALLLGFGLAGLAVRGRRRRCAP